MLAAMAYRSFALLVLVLLLGACSSLSSLEDGSGGDVAPLAASEAEAVRAQSEKALAEQRFKTAWNHEVAAGADRARLERIALGALAARSAHADDMFVALRKKHGALSSGAREGVRRLVSEARAREDWRRALAIELLTADDPPAYTGGWALYREAPADRATALLETLQAAKTDAKQAAKKAAEAAAEEKGD